VVLCRTTECPAGGTAKHVNLKDLEDLLARACERPVRTLFLVACALVIAVLVAYATGFLAEKGRQAAAPEPHASLAEPLPDALPSEWREYTFHLTRDPGASLTLGSCPSPSCYRLTLGELVHEGPVIFQDVRLSGAGFGYRLRPRAGVVAEFLASYKIRGPSLVKLSIGTGEAIAKIALNRSHELKVCTEVLDLRLRVIDDRANSLRLALYVKQGSWSLADSPEKCAWFEDEEPA